MNANAIIINGVVYEYVVCNEYAEGLGDSPCDFCALEKECYRNRDDEPCRIFGEYDSNFLCCFKEWHG